ncbi:paraquat-inducible protein A [Paenalcaligenes niemegkensis]|uniref:paraquat-inducible protein A n=1 Tax=Paenalcaligenes niemegkensis TaxID=2895469 RepID=UPI001EE9626F|nr:paraquat-inducible protein A [Paenalcaligenes niemegkensis]MCQ9616612.1 paraquat-inducible protein A [Paenalcaligenes niemegkensis]
MGEPPLFACPHCDALHTQVSVRADESAECGQCAYVLNRGSKLKVNDWLALVFGALVLFVIANVAPLVSLTLQGRSLSPNLPSALVLTWQQGHYSLSIMSGLMGLWFPLLLLLFRLWALWLIKIRRSVLDFALGMRIMGLLEHWSMVPVVFLGVLVAMVKFAGIANMEFEFGIWAYAALMLVYTGTSKLDSRRLWEMAAEAGIVIAQAKAVDPEAYVACTACGLVQSPVSAGEACQRCASRLSKRKINMRSRTLALLAAAMVLYIPANVLPIMQLRSPLGLRTIRFWAG